MSAAGMGGMRAAADRSGGAPRARPPPQVRSPKPPHHFLPHARRLLERRTQGVRAALAESQVVRALSEGLVRTERQVQGTHASRKARRFAEEFVENGERAVILHGRLLRLIVVDITLFRPK